MTHDTSLDVLAIGAHPDDVELSAGGTVCLLVDQGYRVGIVDLTRGELGSRGNVELRKTEAEESARVLGVSVRENLGIPDGSIRRTQDHRLRVVRALRRYRPGIVLTTAPTCRHPDHEDACALVCEAVFHAGLSRIEVTDTDSTPLAPWRPQHVLHYMQSIEFVPSIVVDVSSVWERRMKALLAFKSQFHHEDYEAAEDEPDTFVSNPSFLRWIEARAVTYGYRVGAAYGEPFLYRHGPIGTDNLVEMLKKERPHR